MSSAPSPTDRLISARPLVVESLDQLVSADQRADLLAQILASPLTEPVHVRSRRRRLQRRGLVTAVVGVAAAALVAATLAAHLWPRRSAGETGPRMSAVLLAHVTAAVGNVDDVAVITSTSDGVSSTFWTLTRGGQATRMRYSVDGQPSYDQTISRMHGRRTITNVDFAAHAWWKEVVVPLPGNACAFAAAPRSSTAIHATATPQGATRQAGGSSCQVFGPTPRDVVRSLNSGQFQVTGHPVIDGRPAIQLTAHYPGTSGAYELFVDARSFLPLVSINSVNTAPFTTTYRYLPATPANIALLQVPIPPGFRHADQPVRCDPSQLGPHGSPDGCP